MRWVLIAVGVLAVLVLVIVGVGYTLPVAHTAQRAVTLRAAPSDVWATITDVAAYPSWRDGVESVEVLASRDGKQVWREKGKDGEITYAMTRADPPSRLVTRVADTGLPFGGEWDYEISPNGTGSRVVITERGEVYNPVFRFISRFVIGPTATLDTYLRSLGTKFGETVTPIAVTGP